MSEDLVISDVNGICRLCLKGDGTIIPIFGRENTSRDCIPLSKKIFNCVSVEVIDGDGMSSMICVGCVHQVDSWNVFKNTCESSQKKLTQWLHKNKPDIFEKNEAKRHARIAHLVQVNGNSSSVIDLSSDDDEVDLTLSPIQVVNYRQRFENKHVETSTKKLCSTTPSSHSKNNEIISLTTNEIEIFPVSSAICDATNVVNDDAEVENTSSPCLPDITNIDDLNKEHESVEGSSNSQILPDVDAETSENLMNDSAPDCHPEEESISKHLTSEINPDSNDYVLDNPPVNDDTVTSAENENIHHISNVHLSDAVFIEEHPNKANENSYLDATVSTVIDNDHCDPSAEKEISSSTKVGEQLNNEDNSNCSLNQNSLTGQENHDHDPLAPKEKSQVESIQDEQTNRTDKSIARLDDNSSFMIGEVTSLSNTEMPDGEKEPDGNLTNDDIIDDYVDESGQDEHGAWSSQEESTSDVQPDIIMCDSPTINVKEEPLSASEDVDEDPLDFQAIMIKNETDNSQFVSELEDVKPNIGQLSEILSNQYAPKRLKNGKPYCEPCRVSYSTDVSYQRHTLSLRHKLNLKLFKLGKGPTKIGSRSLKSALLGNINDVPLTAQSQGPYRCNYCPSAFKHLRNLRTHQKKHLHGYVRRERPIEPAPLHNESNDVNTKPPIRQSARNLSFAEIPETQCELCNHTFNGMQGLLSHKRYCGLSGSHVCIHCEKAFSTAALLLRHKRECESKVLSPKSFLPSNQNSLLNLDSPSKAPLPSSAPTDGPVVACTLCNFYFHSSTDLITHMQQNHMDFGKPPSPVDVPNFAKPNQFSGIRDSSLHYCKYCPRSFPTYGALSSHTGYHARKSVYFCKFCRQNHRDKVSFRQHMRVHISDPSNRNVCWICYTPFNSQGDLLNHKKNHAMKSTVFPCSFCGNSYNTKELLLKHKRTEHFMPQPPDLMSDSIYDSAENTRSPEKQVQIIDEDYKLFKCKICKKKFSNLGNLKRHAKAHKYGQNPVTQHSDHSSYHRCACCLKAFRTQSGLLNHRPLCSRARMTSAPSVIPSAIPGNPVKCKGCKKWFASKNTLYKHAVMGRCLAEKEQPRTETVSAVKPKNCPNCDQQFLSEETLSRHNQSCKPTIDRLTCDCGEVFSSVDVKLEHGETCSANCTCKFCYLKFNSPEELESHQMVCSSELTSPVENNLPENQQLECYNCNKKFVYSKCLQMHLDKCMYNRWPCSSCEEVFPSEPALALHRKTSCPKLGKSPGINIQMDSMSLVKCEYCKLQFNSQNDLMQHTVNCQKRSVGAGDHSTSSYRPFSCEYCGKTFIWKANMYRHLKLAHLNRKKKFTESTETIRTSSPSTAYKTTSPTDKVTNLFNSDKLSVFRCKLCPDIVFHKQQGFIEHQMIHKPQGSKEPDSTCNTENMLTCELCDRKLPESLYPMHMDEHMNDDFEESNTNQRPATSVKNTTGELSKNESSSEASHETSSKGYPCDLCGKTFSNPSSRKSHRAYHFRAGQGFISPKKLLQNKRHIRCKICNKLLSVNSIHKHNMIHAREDAEFYSGQKDVSSLSLRSTSQQVKQEVTEPEETSSEHQCPKCDQSFGTRILLIGHMKDHADDSFETGSTSSGVGSVDQHPYKCVYCDLSWKYKSVYERHLLSKKHLEVQNQLSGIMLQ